MAWKEVSVMEERERFVLLVHAGGSNFSDLCREFQISRKTGYKFWQRYQLEGLSGLRSRSTKPKRIFKATPEEVVQVILAIKRSYGFWGGGKIRSYMLKYHSSLSVPARSTINTILDRYDLMKHRKKRTSGDAGIWLKNCPQSEGPNDLWCADYKGQFKMGNQKHCFALTITDHFSKSLLACNGRDGTSFVNTKPAFEKAFSTYGLPLNIRTDNGGPFASNGLFGLSQLSAWWLRLGIKIERIAKGRPQQNGSHERMHLTLKQETTKPPAYNLKKQNQIFDRFRSYFNDDRPHESLKGKTPSDFYETSTKKYPTEIPLPKYENHDCVRFVDDSGYVWVDHTRFYLTEALRSHPVGLRQEGEGIWSVNFMHLELGCFDSFNKKFIALTAPRPTSQGILKL
jgi:transposase InsO family protein